MTKNDTKPTIDEVAETLTGDDEDNIYDRFGADWTDLLDERPTKFKRALVWVLLTREGAEHGDAHKQVKAMRLGEVNEYFGTPADDGDLDSESGKDGSDGSSEPKSKQPSAS